MDASPYPKTVAILKSDCELLPKTSYPKTIPVRYFYGMSDRELFQQVHEFVPGSWARDM